MIAIAAILFYGIAGAASVILSHTRLNRKRCLATGYFFLAAGAAGFFGAGIPSLLYYVKMQTNGGADTLYQLIFFAVLAAVFLCLFVVMVSILSDRSRLIRPIAVLTPFLWAIFLYLGVWGCTVFTTDSRSLLLLGISLCSPLLLCPAAAFLRAAVILKRPGVLGKILFMQAQKEEKKEAGRVRRMQKKRLRSPRKRRNTK